MNLYTISYKSSGFAKIGRVHATDRTLAMLRFTESYPYAVDAYIVAEKRSVIV